MTLQKRKELNREVDAELGRLNAQRGRIKSENRWLPFIVVPCVILAVLAVIAITL